MAKLINEITHACRGRLRINEKIGPHTTIKIGGPAECWFEPEDVYDLALGVEIARRAEAPVSVIGGGSNFLAPDLGIQGLVVHLSNENFKRIKLESDIITAGASVSISKLLQFLLANDFGRCEFLAGIPAHVGGAIAMNAGTSDRWMYSVLREVKGVDHNGKISVRMKDEIEFGYRASNLSDFIITEAKLSFPRIPREETRKNLERYAEYRKKTQDLQYPNAGCMFRNPSDVDKSAGQLIEEAGLKGRIVGKAQISNIHGNFVVNLGGASHADVLEIIKLVEKTILDKYHVNLEREIRIMSDDQ